MSFQPEQCSDRGGRISGIVYPLHLNQTVVRRRAKARRPDGRPSVKTRRRRHRGCQGDAGQPRHRRHPIAHRLGVSLVTLYRYLPAARTANSPGVDNGRSTPNTGRCWRVSAWRRAAAVAFPDVFDLLPTRCKRPRRVVTLSPPEGRHGAALRRCGRRARATFPWVRRASRRQQLVRDKFRAGAADIRPPLRRPRWPHRLSFWRSEGNPPFLPNTRSAHNNASS